MNSKFKPSYIAIAIVLAIGLIAFGVYLYGIPQTPVQDIISQGEVVLVPDEFEATSETTTEQGEFDSDSSNDEASSNPEGESEISLPHISLVNVAPDGIVVLSGEALPDSTIIVSEDGHVISEAQAIGSGEWVAVLDEALSEGEHLLVVTMRDSEGNETISTEAVVVSLDGSGSNEPLVVLVPFDDEMTRPQVLQSPLGLSGQTEIVVSDTPEVTLTQDNVGATEQPEQPEQMMPTVVIRHVEALSQTEMLIVGGVFGDEPGDETGDELGILVVKVAGEPVVAVRDGKGGYKAEADIPQGLEAFNVIVTLTSPDGEELASAKVRLIKKKLEQILDGARRLVIIQRGDALWRIAYQTYGKGIRYIDIYQSNRQEILDPNLIYPDQVFVIPNQ